jgi:hypothetical protein
MTENKLIGKKRPSLFAEIPGALEKRSCGGTPVKKSSAKKDYSEYYNKFKFADSKRSTPSKSPADA